MNVVSGQWLANWSYRVPVTIDNSSGGALTDFQVKVSFSTFSWTHVKTDGSDIRFTSSDGTTSIPFWIENWTYSSSADIWIKVPFVAAGSSTFVYMYYGNPAATSASNGSNTFEFFDDFGQGSIDYSKWVRIGTPSLAVVLDNGNYALRVIAPGQHFYYLASISESFTDFIFEMKVKMQADLNNQCTPEIAFRYTDNSNNYITMLRGEGLSGGGGPNGDLFIRRYEANVQTNPTPYPAYNYTADHYYHYKIVASQDLIEQHLDGSPVRSWTDTGSGIDQGGIGLGNYGNNSYAVYYDDVFIRKYASTEPGASLGAPENQFPPLTIVGSVTNTGCFEGSDGAIDISVTGGDGSYSYLWSNGRITEDISGLSAGNYSVHVEDGNGSMGDRTFEVIQPTAIIPEVTVLSPLVCSGGTATLEISATGGTPPYTSGIGILTQEAGTMNYTITDNNGCQITFPVTISLPGTWYNTEWSYRKAVGISNPGGTELADFQVKITLDNSFNFDEINQGGSDIRFTTYDGIEIPYWIEEWDDANNEATVWVKVPAILAEGTELYLYYGNEVATSASDGNATFRLFDGFENLTSVVGAWGGTVAHDWKYSMEMQQGALYYSMERAANSWATESMDSEIEDEFDYIHTQINQTTGVVATMGAEPQYCYGVLLSNLALGALYFETINPTLATRCYDNMNLVYGYVRDTYGSVIGTSDGGASSMALLGFSNAWKAFTAYGNSISAAEVKLIIENYVNVFTTTQAVNGAWGGVSGVQEHLKRNFGVLTAYDVDPTNYTGFLSAVNENIDYIIGYYLQPNGGLTWHGSTNESFFECHQQWFMIAVRMLYNRNSTYDFRTEGSLAWNFLTNTNYSGHDMYVHNYVNHNAFFSYRDVTFNGVFQVHDKWKGSYEIGAALWGMALNYDLVSSDTSSYDNETYNYLDEMVKQVKKSSAQNGFFSTSNNWIRILNWSDAGFLPDAGKWERVGTPGAQLVQVDGNNALSVTGSNNHENHFVSVIQDFDNFVFEARILMTEDQNGYADPEIGFHYTDLGNRYFTQMRGTGVNDLFLRRYQGSTQYIDQSNPYDYTQDQFFNYKMVINGNSIKLLINDELVTDYMDDGSVLNGRVYLGNYGTYPVYYDDVRIREYTAVEPIVTFTTEESAFTWTGCAATDVWATGGNWYSGIAPDETDDVIIIPADIYPVVTGIVECATLIIEPGARMTVASGGELTAGLITINSAGTNSAGSLVYHGTVNGTVVYNRHLLPKDSGGDFQLAASPVVTNSEPNTENILRAKAWDEVAGVWTNELMTDVVIGRGYNLKQTETGVGMVTFAGSLPTGNIEVDATCPFIGAYDGSLSGYNARVTVVNSSSHSGTSREGEDNWGGGGWNLLGNPFASAMDVASFIDYNDGASWMDCQFDPSYVALYIHDGNAAEYKYVSISTGWEGGDYLDEPNIQAGQGFFVLAMDDLSTFTFTRDMQRHDIDVPMLKSTKTDDRWPGLQLKVKSGSSESTTLIVYRENMTAGLDPGYDIGQYSNFSGIGLYTTLAAQDNGVNFSRQALPLADYKQNIIPVGVDCETGGEVVFSAITVPIGTYKFWLEDRSTGIYTDLTAKSYTVTLPANSYGTGRFFIIASTNTPTGIERPSTDDTGVRVWISSRKIIISGKVSDRAVCELYDLQGSKLLDRRLAEEELNTIDIPSGLSGVFLVRIVDGGKVTTRKVAIP